MKRTIQLVSGMLAVFLLLFSLPARMQESDAAGGIHVFTVDGAIGPATADYLRRGMMEAGEQGAHLFIIAMDTPGGLDTAMRDIIQNILQSNIPVVTYVTPQGARAASAGTYILYASHVAAMAPATSLGAATPVQMSAPSTPFPSPEGGRQEPQAEDGANGGGEEAGAAEGEEGAGEEEQPAPAPGTAMERKILNDAIAYIRGLAELRGRNAEWAVSAVTEAATLSANEALGMNVIDIVAQDLDALLRELDGRQLSYNGIMVTLSTEGRTVIHEEPDWRVSFLSVITDPNIIMILAMVGIYGLIIEFYNPGFGFAGITGAICLLLAGYGLNLLPINYAGLGLVIFGVILIVAEAFMPSFGIMGVGGIISFIIGSVILIDTDLEVFQVSIPLISAVAVAAAILLIASMRIFMKIRHKPAVTGTEAFIGHHGSCMEDFERTGLVKVDGEIWTAVTDTPLQKGDSVRVDKVEGLRIRVSKV